MVMFFGTELKLDGTFRIETQDAAPMCGFAIGESGKFLVLSSQIVGTRTVRVEDVLGNLEGMDLGEVLACKRGRVLQGVTVTSELHCRCIGYMLLRFTKNASASTTTATTHARVTTATFAAKQQVAKEPAVKIAKSNDKQVWQAQQKALEKDKYKKAARDEDEEKQAAPDEVLLIATAYNVKRGSNNKYQVHVKNKDVGQGSVHTEQVLAYMLRHFLECLTGLESKGARKVGLASLQVQGQVTFRGEGDDGASLKKPCEACRKVWQALKDDYREILNLDSIEFTPD